MNIILFDRLPADRVIPADDFRGQHILKVLKLAVGDRFQLGQVDGPRGIATIDRIDPEGVRYVWEETDREEPMHPVTLIVAQVRPICMKRILREAVSLGVGRIVVTGADTAERSYGDAKLWTTGEYRKYLLDGAMQSGRTGMSELRLISQVGSLAPEIQRWDARLLLDTALDGQPLSGWVHPGGSVALAVGPERGWSDRERHLLISMGFSVHALGSRILRTETACSAGMAVLLGRMGLL